MKCMYCGFSESKVIDSRPADDGAVIRRRRECVRCNKRFTTYEKVDNLPIMVIKKDGKREPFDAEKILHGVRKSCEKRPVSVSDMEKLTARVVKDVSNELVPEISSEQIGEAVMKYLKELDEISYVRFASVYRSFKDINTFLAEINTLMGQKP